MGELISEVQYMRVYNENINLKQERDKLKKILEEVNLCSLLKDCGGRRHGIVGCVGCQYEAAMRIRHAVPWSSK